MRDGRVEVEAGARALLSSRLTATTAGALDGILYGKTSELALNMPLALRMALSLARGLAFLHSSDPPFIHRDVKPANCFVFEDPAVVKIGCDDAAPTSARVP